jgi:hypothetical protein
MSLLAWLLNLNSNLLTAYPHVGFYSLILAGSETSATLLSGCVFYLCKNPSTMKHLTSEIRAAFTTDNQITFSETAKLLYLAAVIEETFRIYPPLVTNRARIVPPGGDTVDGHRIPENVKKQTFSTSIIVIGSGSALRIFILTCLSRQNYMYTTMPPITPYPTLPSLKNSYQNDG